MGRQTIEKFDPEDYTDAVDVIPLIVQAKGQMNMQSSMIKDPLLRLKYETALKANREKYEARNLQFEIRRLDTNYSSTLETYVAKSYSTLPYNLPELKQLLDKYDIGKERKKRILDSVVAQMKYTVEGATSLSSTPPQLPSFEPTPQNTPTSSPLDAPTK